MSLHALSRGNAQRALAWHWWRWPRSWLPGGSALDAGIGAVEAALVRHVRDLEAGRGQHRLEQPAEGAELGADVFGVVLAGVSLGGIRRGVPEPVPEDLFGLGRAEVVDQVAQP